MALLTWLFAALTQLTQIQVPPPVGFVNDFANVIPAETEARIQRVVEDVRAKSRGEIVVVTLPDLRGRDPADVAREIGRQWRVGAQGGPGDAARNAGVIIMVVPKETSSDGRGYSRIETGMGAEGFLTDATTGAIQDQAIPAFRQQDYGTGIELMTLLVAERYAREFSFQLDTSLARMPARDQRPVQIDNIPWPLIFLFIFIVLSMLNKSRRGRRGCGGCLPIFLPFPGGGWGGGHHRGGWGGGGGGGFGGFGGFGSGRSW